MYVCVCVFMRVCMCLDACVCVFVSLCMFEFAKLFISSFYMSQKKPHLYTTLHTKAFLEVISLTTPAVLAGVFCCLSRPHRSYTPQEKANGEKCEKNKIYC